MCRYKKVLIKSFSINNINFIKELSFNLSKILNIEVKYIGDNQLPYFAYDVSRKQFLAEKFLEILVFDKEKDEDIILGITNVDMFEPGLDFVFGMASPFYSIAVVSAKRLHNSFYGFPEDKKIFFERVLKESIHEIGHTVGLEHCFNPLCVMNFSNSIEDTDKKSCYFCQNCRQRIKKVFPLTSKI